jgi:hypothetical protein
LRQGARTQVFRAIDQAAMSEGAWINHWTNNPLPGPS